MRADVEPEPRNAYATSSTSHKVQGLAPFSMPKRALIVDDSRSARVILGRMLEGYGLLVDSSESAEQGLEYLRQARPDVIFMDHLMPGMDGFQAIQAIKGNPDTATIPVVMYTSQEGELYVSQARALGAVGVLPKTVKQSDVSKVLYQLRLLPERREARAAAANDDVGPSVQIEAPRRPHLGDLEGAVRSAVAPLLQEHSSEMRRFVLASLESFSRRLTAETKPAAAPSPPAPEPVEHIEPERAPDRRWPLMAAAVGLALIPTLVLAVLYTRTIETTREIMSTNSRLATVIQDQQTHLAALRDAKTAAISPIVQTADANSIRPELVPYGEVPLSGPRLERLRELISDLKARGFKGKINVETHTGEFCLTGNGFEGYSLASDELPFRRCDLVGNPFDEAMTAPQRQSLAFANLLSSLRGPSYDFVSVEVHHRGRQPVVPYPDSNQERLTAAEWNRAAIQNNRVDFLLEPIEVVTE
jgi:CheY-like chemotaxis protein